MRHFIPTAAVMALLAGCSMGADLKLADNAVGMFHKELNAGDFDAIYQSAAPAFKQSSSDAQFTALLSAIHKKLGNYVSGKQIGSMDNLNTSGHFMNVLYSSKFEGGDATENFSYLVTGNKVALYAYNVNSNALILR